MPVCVRCGKQQASVEMRRLKNGHAQCKDKTACSRRRAAKPATKIK